MPDQAEQHDDDDRETADAPAAVAALAAKYGDAQRAAERLYEINQRLLRKVERLEQRPQLPDGGRVVGKEDGAKLDAYTELGSPEEVQQKIQTADEARTELGALKRRETVRAVATATGWKAEVLENLPGSGAWSFEVREETEPDGKGGVRKATTAYVVPGENKPPVKLREHVTADLVLNAFLPALEVTQPQTRTGVQQMPISPAEGKATTEGSGVDALLKANHDRANAPNALRPPTVTYTQ